MTLHYFIKRIQMNIYVGNLSRNVDENELKEAFQAFGTVTSAVIIKDKFSGEPKGFGFVEMPNAEEAQAAIQGLNGQDLSGRNINVNEARPRESRPGSDRPRSGGFGGGNGGRRNNRF